MNLAEAVQVFDEVPPADGPLWIMVHGERVGWPSCCGLPVSVESTDGLENFWCGCGRTISWIGQQWVITNWGKRGIQLVRLPFSQPIPALRASGTVTELGIPERNLAQWLAEEYERHKIAPAPAEEWRVQCAINPAAWWLHSQLHQLIAEFPDGMGQEDNARRASAAPELYRALLHAIEVMRVWHGMGRPDSSIMQQAWETYVKHAPEMKPVIAALAKARGKAVPIAKP